jgi:hypothetical protein
VIDLGILRHSTYRASIIGGTPLRIAIGASPFLMPLMLQLGFGLSPLASGTLTMATALGSLATRTVMVKAIRTVDAAGAQPQRRRQVDEAAERQRVRRGQQTASSTKRARRLEPLAQHPLARELDREPDRDADADGRALERLVVGEAAQHADELVRHRRAPLGRLLPAFITVWSCSSTG